MRGSVDACAQTCRRAHPGRVHPAWAVPEAGRPRGDRLRRQGTDRGRRGPCERRAGDQARAAVAGWRCSGVRRPSGPRCPTARIGCRLSSRRYRRAGAAGVGTPSWQASQAWPGGSAGPGPPDGSGAGSIFSSQHSGQSKWGRPCRPCPCSHTKYAAPATATTLSPPPKGRPGALGMREGIAVHHPSVRRRDRG
jgi:hypothetical protein